MFESGDVSEARPTHCLSLDIHSSYAELWPDQREGGFVSFCFISGQLCQSLSTARYFVTQQIILSGYLIFAMVNFSSCVYICITASDPFVSTSDGPELLEVKIGKIWKTATQGEKVLPFKSHWRVLFCDSLQDTEFLMYLLETWEFLEAPRVKTSELLICRSLKICSVCS